jgi:hypothetical protein
VAGIKFPLESSPTVGKFGCADLPYIRLRELSNVIQRILQLLLIAFQLLVGSLRWNRDKLAEA